MKYFALASGQIQPKNKAQKQADELSYQVDGTLIYDDEDLDLFVETFKKQIEEINRENPRCTDLQFRKLFYPQLHQRGIYIDGCFNIQFYEVKHET